MNDKNKSMYMNKGWYNGLVLSSSRFISAVLSFLTMVLLARRLGVYDYGLITVVFAFTSFIDLACDFGLTAYFTREAAKNDDYVRKHIGRIFVFRIALMALVLPFVPIAGKILNYSSSMCLLFLICALGNGFLSTAVLIRSIFYIKHDLVPESAITILYAILKLGVVAILLWTGYRYRAILVGLLLLNIAFVFSVYYYARSRFDLRLSVKWPGFMDMRTHLHLAYVFGLLGLIGLLYTRMSVLLLSKLTTFDAVGVYDAQYRFVQLVALFSGSVGALLLPLYSKNHLQMDWVKENVRNVNTYSLKLLVPIVFFMVFYSEALLRLLFSQEIASGHAVLSVLSLTFWLLFVNVNLGSLLLAKGHQKTAMWNSLACALVNIILNIILIPRLKIMGSAIAYVGAEITLLSLNLIFTRKYYHGIKAFTSDKTLYGAILVFGGGYCLALTVYPVASAILLTAAFYLFVFRKDIIRLAVIRSEWKNRNKEVCRSDQTGGVL
ncbi:MAG: oligosaccharide flippase family protein [Fibrobacterota bacterium]